MGTSSDTNADGIPASRGGGPIRKARTSDCEHCVLLSSLRAEGVPAATCQAICDRMWLNRARRRQILYSEGNGATHLYAIRSGRVKLVRIDASGRARIATTLGSGDLFGFEAIFDYAYGTCAEALTDCELCLASADQLRKLMAEVPRVAVDLARYLHRQLSSARDRQAAIAATGASAKLAGYLLHSLSASNGADGDLSVARNLTLSDLGGILGMSPETVCRVLARLRTLGIVETLRTEIRVRDVESLRSMAGL